MAKINTICEYRKIGIIGPECSGKTQLATDLAEYFNCHWEPEYARSYVEQLQHPYTYNDVISIAQHQITREKELDITQKERFIFFDTELIITKIWLLHVYGCCPNFIEEHIQHFPMDFYLLCAPDLPWQDDSVRENKNKRNFFFDWYKKEIEQTGKPYGMVQGTGQERFNCALKYIL